MNFTRKNGDFVVLFIFNNMLNKKEPLLLFLGDICVFAISLYLSLIFRYLEVPELDNFFSHISDFSVLILLWTVSFFVAGLYDTKRVILRNKIPEIVMNAGIANILIAVGFFYFNPFLGISPKTILFIFIVISFALVSYWRILSLKLFVSKKKIKAIIIASGKDVEDLNEEVNKNPRFNFKFVKIFYPEKLDKNFVEEIQAFILAENIKLVVIDSKNQQVENILDHLYGLVFANIHFVEVDQLFEEIFSCIPISTIKYDWFIGNISNSPRQFYDFFKRLFDILISIPLIIVSLIFYPFVFFVLLFDGGEGFFGVQERVGQFGEIVKIWKFRTMLFNDNGNWDQERQNKVTQVGAVLRKLRIDELPQLFNVLKGDISLIGPRPEFPMAVKKYSEEIPYYNIRHLIKPGLSGWAQIYHDTHPHHGIDIEETKNKLSYDLFYVKNRSIILDMIIVLKTIKIILSRQGK